MPFESKGDLGQQRFGRILLEISHHRNGNQHWGFNQLWRQHWGYYPSAGFHFDAPVLIRAYHSLNLLIITFSLKKIL
jgi:hypothetical protein